jgi:acetoin:2,6-dichlorophenolindophenol oxidoreductase subunit beta
MREISYSEALREAIREEMKKDKNVLLIGEEIGAGYGGVFGVSTGLLQEFGPTQIIDTPIAENTILGTGLGTAILGMKPIVELMFEDFISVCFDGILNQAAKWKFMSGDQYNLNLVVRLPGGSGGGTGPHHSQCLESIFMSIPGLKLVLPSNAYDAKGLLKTCINLGEPVLFFEHKKLYKIKSSVPEEEYTIPLGKGKIVKEGKDLTIVATSYMVRVAEEVVKELEDRFNIDIEIIDPRTLVPLDIELISGSVKKTGKLVTLEEGVLRGGVGAEISSQISEKFFDFLDFPVKRIASKNMFIPMSPLLEESVIPNRDSIIKEIVSFLRLQV